MDDSDEASGLTPSDAACLELKAAGWSIGDAAFTGPSGGLVWVVSGTKGDRQIRAEGATRDEAWTRALAEAERSARTASTDLARIAEASGYFGLGSSGESQG